MNHLRCALLSLVLVACGAGSSGDRSTLASIPRPAAAALTAQAGTAKIKHVSREVEGDRELFEASWWEGDLEREAKVTATGELVELEIQVREADVPAPVRAAAAKSLAGATTIKYVRLRGDLYEAEAVIGGKEHDVTLTATGAPAPGDDDDDHDGDGGDDDGEHED